MLITGASGYIGGRLMAALESAPCRIRCLSRDPAYLESRVRASTRVFRGDVLDAESLRSALAGVDTAYYLIHSMASSGDFESLDRRVAKTFGHVANEEGVQRIIYLGGLAHLSRFGHRNWTHEAEVFRFRPLKAQNGL